MNIAVIGAGNVGCTLAAAFVKAGHTVIFGVRVKCADFKGKAFAIEQAISWENTLQAVGKSEVIILCTPAHLAHEVASELGDVSNKVIIDTMNGLYKKPKNYPNTTLAIMDNCNCPHIAKCFNSTGFENMANPMIDSEAIDMFVAGSSVVAKEIATKLAKDIGYGKVWDFGDDEQFTLLENLAMCWINLAIIQKNGRRIGFKLVTEIASDD